MTTNFTPEKIEERHKKAWTEYLKDYPEKKQNFIPNIMDFSLIFITSELESYKAELRKETEEETIENLKVGFLRQYLNESNLWKGKMFTNEDLIGFIKIAYKGSIKTKTPEGV